MEEARGFYSISQAATDRLNELPPSCSIVYMAFKRREHISGWKYRLDVIANETGLSLDTVQKAVQSLMDSGLLDRQEQRESGRFRGYQYGLFEVGNDPGTRRHIERRREAQETAQAAPRAAVRPKRASRPRKRTEAADVPVSQGKPARSAAKEDRCRDRGPQKPPECDSEAAAPVVRDSDRNATEADSGASTGAHRGRIEAALPGDSLPETSGGRLTPSTGEDPPHPEKLGAVTYKGRLTKNPTPKSPSLCGPEGVKRPPEVSGRLSPGKAGPGKAIEASKGATPETGPGAYSPLPHRGETPRTPPAVQAIESRDLVDRLQSANVYAKAAYDLSFRRPEHVGRCIEAWEFLKGRSDPIGPGLLVAWIVGARELPEVGPGLVRRAPVRLGARFLDMARAAWIEARDSGEADDWFRTAALIRTAAAAAGRPDLEAWADKADVRGFEAENGPNPVFRTERRKTDSLVAL